MSDVNKANHKEDHTESDIDELKKLQQRLNHESIKYQFRTKLVGGLNEEDVTKYIEDLEDKLKKIETENKKSSDEIYSLKTKLNTELEIKDNIQKDLDEAKHDLITAILEFKQKQMDYKSVNEKYISENIHLKNEMQKIAEERRKLENLINDSKREKELLKQYSLKADDEINILRLRIAKLTEESLEYAEIKNDNNQYSKELKEIESLLNQSRRECDRLKEISAKIENENNQIKATMSELTDENKHIKELKNENIQMIEEIKAYEELLNHTSIEYEQLEKSSNKLKNENIHISERISHLENSISEKNYEINEINLICEELKKQLQDEKSNNEKLNIDSVILKQKINSLQQTVNEKLKELEEQKKISDNAALELNMEKAEMLNYKINGFKQEFSNVFEKIDTLEREAKQSSKLSIVLKQQLTIQQNRAEKAENDLTKIIDLLSQVDGKFYNDIFGDEFIHLIEKQASKQHELNDKIINL